MLFLALIIIEIILLFALIEYEQGIWATLSLIGFCVAMQLLGYVDLVNYILNEPTRIVALVGAYFILGTIWSVFKWWLLCHDKLEEYKALKDTFLRSRKIKEITDAVKGDWVALLERHKDYEHGNRRFDEPPLVRYYKADILRWMSFWVVSLIWTLLDDFVKRVFKIIYQKIVKLLQNIADSMFDKKDL